MNKLFYYAKHNNMKLTLVIPVFSEKDINISKKVISEIISSSEEIIDEVTVNDLGMLFYIKEKFNIKINLGRLFFKEPRDLRVPEYYYTEVVKPEIAKIICDREIKEHISLIELDEVCNKICTDNIDDFISKCRLALAENDPDLVKARMAAGEAASWDNRVRQMEDCLRERGIFAHSASDK